MQEEDPRLYNIKLFAGQVYSACNLTTWCYGMVTKRKFFTTNFHEKDFWMFFAMSGCLEYIQSPERDFTKPVFLSDSIGMLWAADYVLYDGIPELAFIIGPVFPSRASVKSIRDSLNAMPFSASARNSLLAKLQTVPVVSTGRMMEYTSMLHYTLTEEKMSAYDFQYQDIGRKDAEDIGRQSIGRTDAEQAYSMEKLQMKLVREGDLNYRQIMAEHTGYNNLLRENSEKPLRESQDAVIVIIALCARAAAEGGVSWQICAEQELYYVSQVEKADNLSQLISIKDEVLDDFVNRVHDCKEKPHVSKPVQGCCEYVQRHLMEPIELSDIAGAVGYTEYYLTKKFNKEMGMRLLDYIKESKLEMAKILLITTGRSIQEISDQLNFGSRDYFSKVFRKSVGMTPAEFREQSRVKSPEGKTRKINRLDVFD